MEKILQSQVDESMKLTKVCTNDYCPNYEDAEKYKRLFHELNDMEKARV